MKRGWSWKFFSIFSPGIWWIWCLASIGIAAVVVHANPAEYTFLSNFKESGRLDRGLTSAEFINSNGIPNHNSIGSSFSGGNVNAPTMLMGADDRMFETYTYATVNHTYYDSEGEFFRLSGENNAKFGEGRVFPVEGKLVHVTSAKDPDDHTACHSKILGTRGKNLPKDRPWIALVKRGVCKFEDKVRHVYEEHAIAIIVYNDRDSQNLDKMQIVDKERNITAVFTYKGIGEQLAKLVDGGFELTTTISPGETVIKQYQNMNRTSVLFVSISFIILMIISLVWLVFYYVQRFRYLQSKDKQSRRMCNVAKRIIAKIPTKSVRTEDKELQNECCPICIEQYRVSDLIRVLPCKHEFHKNCIDPWLLDHRLCPMCKMDILKYYGFVFCGSQESILQMDLDVGEDDPDNVEETNHHSRGVSPMPQIRSERLRSRSSSMISDVDVQVVTETTPSLVNHWMPESEEAQNSKHREVVVPYRDEVTSDSSKESFQQETASNSQLQVANTPGEEKGSHCNSHVINCEGSSKVHVTRGEQEYV